MVADGLFRQTREKPRHRHVYVALPFLFLALIIISLPMSAGTIQGRVLDRNGSPLPHVRMDFSGPVERTTITDVKGQYRVTAPDGQYRVRFTSQKRREEKYEVIPGGDEVRAHDFLLSW